MRFGLAVGSLVFILGFIGYQVGSHLIPQESRTVTDFLLSLLPGGIPTETLGLALQFGGGIVAIVGLVMCLASLSRSAVRLQPVGVSRTAPETVEGSRCRFCGGALEEDAVFCPVCGKSQK